MEVGGLVMRFWSWLVEDGGFSKVVIVEMEWIGGFVFRMEN